MSTTPPSTRTDPEGDSRKAVATSLGAGLTVLTVVLGAFGGLTGAVARMARNYPILTAVVISFVVLSVAVALAAQLVTMGTSRNQASDSLSTQLMWGSLGLFVLGLAGSAFLLSQAIDTDDRPSVTAQVTRGEAGAVTVAGTAKAGGLSAKEQVYVLVNTRTSPQDVLQVQAYYALVGPNPDGLVEHPFSVLIAPGIREVVVTVGTEEAGGACTPPLAQAESPAPSEPPAKGATTDGPSPPVSGAPGPPVAPRVPSPVATPRSAETRLPDVPDEAACAALSVPLAPAAASPSMTAP